jgi:hypothetical protein
MPRISTIFFFVGIISALLIAINTAVYQALVALFAINNPLVRTVLGLSLGILSTSFVAALVLSMRFYNRFTRLLYLVTAVWMGFFAYLCLALLAFALIAVLWEPSQLVGMTLIGLALFISIYGLVHARHIIVRRVTVSLPNLPAAWRGRRALWMSDLHLGQLYGPRFAGRIVEATRALAPDIIFIGGDLYDGGATSGVREIAGPLWEMQAPLGVYFITGNHEEFDDRERFVTPIRSAGFRILSDEKVEIDGMQLLGVDHSDASDRKRFQAILVSFGIDRARPSILLKHEPRDLDIAEQAGISFSICGHTHRAQQWPLEYIARAVHREFAYGLKQLGRMRVYTSSGVGTWGPPMRVGTDSEIVLFEFK